MLQSYIYKKGINILLPKYQSLQSNQSGITSLLGNNHVIRFSFTLHSLFFFLKKSLQVFIIDYGTLTTNDKIFLKNSFNAQILNSTESGGKISKLFNQTPYLLKFRFDKNNFILKKKLDPIFISPFKKTLYLDSDILFFKKPQLILQWLTPNKSHQFYYLTYPKSTYKKYKNFRNPDFQFRRLFHQTLNRKSNIFFNSGILLFNHNLTKQLPLLNKACSLLYQTDYVNMILAEELLLSCLFTRTNSHQLNSNQHLTLVDENDYQPHFKKQVISLHYSHLSKTYFYQDSLSLLKKLIKKKFIND